MPIESADCESEYHIIVTNVKKETDFEPGCGGRGMADDVWRFNAKTRGGSGLGVATHKETQAIRPVRQGVKTIRPETWPLRN